MYICILRVCLRKPLQIEELTSNLQALQALSSSASSVDSMASSETGSPPMKRKVTKFQGSAKKAMLRWVQNTATKYAIFRQLKEYFRINTKQTDHLLWICHPMMYKNRSNC